jgi:carbon storage regulator
MLVLSRRPEQSLLLGDDVTVIVLAVDGDRVKLGIQAPASVSILRGELYAQLKAANAAAATNQPTVARVTEALRTGRLGPPTPQ